jgi:Helix-turn-helix domain
MQKLLTTTEAAEHCGLSIRTMERLRCVGGGSKYVRLRGSVRYRLSDLELWIDARVVSSTSEMIDE